MGGLKCGCLAVGGGGDVMGGGRGHGRAMEGREGEKEGGVEKGLGRGEARAVSGGRREGRDGKGYGKHEKTGNGYEGRRAVEARIRYQHDARTNVVHNSQFLKINNLFRESRGGRLQNMTRHNTTLSRHPTPYPNPNRDRHKTQAP